ncbi:hypothetical protein CRE_17022 [Caenorhabditis remanei]|uniref:Uncharacterized protein n=1 Tax=Caenorhabditis remanei TaxID=31234 RepID=E3N7W6_CAERE|nr:hypothetical protein CRE_17022 [Caenorhabditis remanei]
MAPDVLRQEQVLISRPADAQRIFDQMVEIAPVLIDRNASNPDVLDACVAIRELNQQLMNFDEHRAFALEFEQVLIRMVARLERAIAAAEEEAGSAEDGGRAGN